MDNKFEDQIAKMAFGELSEAEAKDVKAHAAANADAAQMLASYEALRSDLRRLKDVPPDQLSKERLQNAILTQGLKPKPVRRSNPWAWAASGVFVLGLAVVLLAKPAQQTKQPVVMDFAPKHPSSIENAVRSVDQSPDTLNQDDRDLMNQVLAFTPAKAPEPKETIKRVSATDELPKDAVASVPPRIDRSESKWVYHKPTDRHDRPAIDEATQQKDSVALKPVAKKAPETLVLIQSDKDDNTGANSAVEVHQTEDVIVSS